MPTPRSFRFAFLGVLLAIAAATVIVSIWSFVPMYRDYQTAERLRGMSTEYRSLEFGRKVSAMVERGEGGPFVIAMLAEGTKDPRNDIRDRCVGALAKFAVARRHIYRELIDALGDDEKTIRMRVWGDLDAIPDLSIPTLIDTLSSDNPRLRAGAIEALASFRGNVAASAIPDILSMVDDKDDRVREYAIWALGTMVVPVENSAAIERIVQALEDPAERVRHEALNAIGSCNLSDIEPMIRAVLSDDPEMSLRASYSIHTQSQFSDRIVEALVNALHDRRRNVRVNVICALGRMGPNGSEAVPALHELLNDDDSYVRFPAARSIVQITGECSDVLPTILEPLQDPTSNWHWAALNEIRNLHPGAEGMRLLADLLRQSDEMHSLLIIDAIGNIAAAPEVAVPALIQALDDQKPQQCIQAMSALAAFGGDAWQALPALKRLATQSEFRRAAQTTITAIQSGGTEKP